MNDTVLSGKRGGGLSPPYSKSCFFMSRTCVCDTRSIDMSQYLAKNGTIFKSLFVDNLSNELPKTFR